LGGGLRAENNAQIVLETSVNRVLYTDLDDSGSELGSRYTAGKGALLSGCEQLIQGLGNIQRRCAAAQLLCTGGQGQKRQEQPSKTLSNLHR
jgi:hypothetical protein